MLFIIFIASVFGVLNVIFLFFIVFLNELFLIAVENKKCTSYVLMALFIFILLYLISPTIDPLNIDLLTVVIIVLFSTISIAVMLVLYKSYRKRIHKHLKEHIPINNETEKTEITNKYPRY